VRRLLTICTTPPEWIAAHAVDSRVANVRNDDGGADPLGRQSEPPAPCPRCGRQPNVVCVVYDPDFYGNAERLASLGG